MLAADCAAHVALVTCDVQSCSISDAAAWHIDPDRRRDGRRTTSLARCGPDGACIERLLSRVPHAAIKLAPAAIVPDDWPARCELEWIGRDRRCRQLMAWHGDLAARPGMRRATVLFSSTANDGTLAARSVVGQPGRPMPIVERPDRFVLEPDPAVLAARLTGALAAEHGLAALAPGPTYLTGAEAPADPALVCFAVEEVLPLKRRMLAVYLRERRIGQLEIKKRGVELEPQRLRRELKLRGDQAATLLVTRVAGRPATILARRVHQTSDQHETAVARRPGQL